MPCERVVEAERSVVLAPAWAFARGWSRRGLVVLLALAATACDSLLKSDRLPSNVTDPAITETPQGALTAYYGAVVQFRDSYGAAKGSGRAFGQYAAFILTTGLLSDELTGSDQTTTTNEDLRVMPEGPTVGGQGAYSQNYSQLQRMRGQANQAIALLANYLPEQPDLAAHVYALEGYAEVFLAELYCSGIPLSTLDYKGDYTPHAPSTTEAVFTHAVALFDSALALASDSVNFQRLAQVGKARALLALGQYAMAAAAVSAIPDGYSYVFRFDSAAAAGNFAQTSTATFNTLTYRLWDVSVLDPEGFNGLNYGTSGDPRATVTKIDSFKPTWHPDKYALDGSSPIVLASGLEARLIEAEAALQSSPNGGQWLVTLNALRTDGTFTVDSQAVINNTVSPPDTTWTYDTLWHAGIGGTAGLAPLADPGTTAGRVDLLFRERAFWLFLTGHRQGDLRRLIRQYGRTQDQIYPVGATPSGLLYGDDVTEPIPYQERDTNPLFHGCLSREA